MSGKFYFCYKLQIHHARIFSKYAFNFVDRSNMGNLMTRCVCGKPEFEDQTINKDSDSGQNNFVPKRPKSIQIAETEIVSNHETSSDLTNSNENIGGQDRLNAELSVQIEDSYNVEQHTNTGDLCDILKIQNFSKSEGPSLKDKLQPDQGSNKFGKIHKKT